VSTSWPGPDTRPPRAAAPAFGAPDVVPGEDRPSLSADLLAGAAALVVTVLLGAPVGLAWAAVAPRVAVVIDGGVPRFVEPASDAFIAADGYFLLAVALAGAVGGAVGELLGRRHGPAVVAGLALGGVAAAYVAMVAGQEVGADAVAQAVRSGQDRLLELNLQLRAKEALLGWPVGALLGYLGAAWACGRRR
jgi:hypothetical protein